ncbi:DivIVA domain-containing protein [Nocardiopsis sediminis]|uniref:DivIVA domain-containing protein n=1 Tax=Nocardiopsis sediminis TaxID=1778267 RepID=A0ABV8FQC0_9ACTN
MSESSPLFGSLLRSSPGSPSFEITRRGYDRRQVDRLVEGLTRALAARRGTADTGDGSVAGRARAAAGALRVARRGYDRAQVDSALARMIAELQSPAGDGAPGAEAGAEEAGYGPWPDLAAARFDVVLRGYDRHEVEALLVEGVDAVAAIRAGGRVAAGPTAAELRERCADLPVVLRGFDRGQVTAFVDDLCAALKRAGDARRSPGGQGRPLTLPRTPSPGTARSAQ